MEGGRFPPKTGNTAAGGTGGRWLSMAERTVWWPGGVLLKGLARFWPVVTTAGRDIDASLKRCSVKVLVLGGCKGPIGTLGKKGKLGTM